MSPGADPLAELASRLAAIEHVSAIAILNDLEADPRALDLAGRYAGRGEEDDSLRLVLAVDQMEELFTMCHDRGQQRQFAALLAHAMAADPQRVIPVFAVRADLYGELGSLPGIAQMLERGHMLLGPPAPADLRDAIEGPVRAAGLAIEPELTERILTDLGDAPGALPLLSHALHETWKIRAGRTLALAGYLRSGGIRGAIAQTAERVFAELQPGERAACQELMLRLTVLGEGAEPTRRRVAFIELSSPSEGRADPYQLAQKFAEARLLTMSADSVEVAHEALIREWPRLREWLEEGRESHRILRHLTQSAESWDRLGRDRDELYRGARLAAASEWAQRAGAGLSTQEREFLGASLKAQDEERLRDATRFRRLRLLASGLAGLVVIAALVSGIALWQWNRANDHRARAEAASVDANAQRDAAQASALEATLARLETEIPLLLEPDRSLAFLLARQAYDLAPGPRTSSLMNRVLSDDPRWLGAIHPSESLVALYFPSLDGKYVALSTQSGLLELRDPSTHAVVSSTPSFPGLTTNTALWFPSSGLVAHAAKAPAGETGVNIYTVPELELVRTISWDKEAEQLGGFGMGYPEVAILRKAAPDGCCQSLRLVDAASGAGRTVALPALQFTPNFYFDATGRYVADLVAGPDAGKIALLDSSTFALLAMIRPTGDSFRWYDVSQDGSVLLTGYSFGNLQAWDPATGELLGTGKVDLFSPGQFSLNPNGTLAAIALATDKYAVMSVPELTPVGPPFLVGPGGVFTAFGANDETYFSFTATHNEVDHWAINGDGLVNAQSLSTGVGRSEFAPDGSWMVKQSPDGSWSRWSLPGLTLLNRSGVNVGTAANNRFSLTAISPIVSADGKYIATANTDCPRGNQAGCSGKVVLWNAETGMPVGQPIPVANADRAGGPGIVVAFHPNLPLLALGGPPPGSGQQTTIEIWSFEAGDLKRQSSFLVPTSGQGFGAMTFSTFAAGGGPALTIASELGRVALWETSGSTPRLRTTRQFGRQSFLDGSQQGWIVEGDGTDIKIFTAEQFALGDGAEPTRVLKAAMPKNDGAFARVSFTDDGRLMALAQFGATARVSLWDLQTGESIASSFNWLPSGTAGRPDDVFLAPDGSYLVVSNDNATVVWDLDITHWAEKTCEAAGRNFTQAEWTKYFPGREYATTCPRWPVRQ
ncbi:MAG: hypothetical protein IPI33_01680 [Dehalococcoidia bacterium]|nr:hypothetical protein [Dehalococcoidia bacterium]